MQLRVFDPFENFCNEGGSKTFEETSGVIFTNFVESQRWSSIWLETNSKKPNLSKLQKDGIEVNG